MNIKCFISFVLLFSFVSCGLATPTPRLRRDVSEESLLPKEVNESLNKIAKDVEKSAKKLFDSFQWIYKSFESIARTTIQGGLQNAASWLVDYAVRLELLSMADGSHVFFPLNGEPEIEQDRKTIAVAVSKLMMNLKTMERTDKVLKNVSRLVYHTDLLKKEYVTPEESLRMFSQVYLETLDREMGADEDLRVDYQQRKTEAKEEVKRDSKMLEPVFKYSENGKLIPPTVDFNTFAKDKKTLSQAFPNKLFLKQTTKHFQMIFSPQHHQRYLMARALIQKARSDSKNDSKINKLYNKALAQAAFLPVIANYDQLSNVLFNSIEILLESDPTLQAEIQTMMKQIEGSTVYDIDMFSVDLAML